MYKTILCTRVGLAPLHGTAMAVPVFEGGGGGVENEKERCWNSNLATRLTCT